MNRKCFDCRFKDDYGNCTVTLCADTDAQLMSSVLQHLTIAHNVNNSSELVESIKNSLRKETISKWDNYLNYFKIGFPPSKI